MKEIFWQSVLKAASWKRTVNAGRILFSLGCSVIFRKTYVSGVPFILNIEPTVRCNLFCPQCLTGLGLIRRNSDSLSFDLFKQIIDEVSDKLWYVLLYNQGEPFLNDQLIDFIHLAKQKRLYVTTSTNGHFLTDASVVEKLVTSGLDSIFVSLDGTDQSTYERYRVGGDFDRVLSGIKLIVETKKNLKAKTPRIMLQFLVMKHNQHQVTEIKNFKKRLKVDRILIKTVQIADWSRADDFLPSIKKYNRYLDPKNHIDLINKKNKLCRRLWYSTVVLADGRVVPCCFDKNGRYAFGNLSKQTLLEIWHSDGYRRFRVCSKQNRYSIDLCGNCTAGQKIFL